MAFIGMQIGDDGEHDRAIGDAQQSARGRAVHHLVREAPDVYSVVNQMQFRSIYPFAPKVPQHGVRVSDDGIDGAMKDPPLDEANQLVLLLIEVQRQAAHEQRSASGQRGRTSPNEI